MDQSLKPGTAAFRKIKSHAKQLQLVLGMLILIFSTLACNFPVIIAGSGSGGAADPAETPVVIPTLNFPTLQSTPPKSAGYSTSTVDVTPTSETPPPPVMYYTQSGDTLENLCLRFSVSPENISSPDPVPSGTFLRPGQLLFIQYKLGETTPTTALLPDSEITYSPTSIDFDIDAFVRQAGGYLSTYTEYLGVGTRSGARVVLQVARENSVNPRLLLALLEYESGWVYGRPDTLAKEQYPLGMVDNTHKGLYKQLNWAVKQLFAGYYGWRTGRQTELQFIDGEKMRIAPSLNAGTVAVQYFFSQLYCLRDWGGVLYAPQGFIDLYQRMFDSPWVRAQSVEPVLTPDLAQPLLDLPFAVGRTWSFTGGPHPAWASGSPLAALDFAPASDVSGCHDTYDFVTAPASGLVVRSENGVVVLDLDGDGYEQTGWVLLLLHIADKGRVPVGTLLDVGENVGHPSCEGGNATGTHVHIARKYNGEWIPIDSPLQFVLSGWTAHMGNAEYYGTLTRDGRTVTASQYGSAQTNITNDAYTP